MTQTDAGVTDDSLDLAIVILNYNTAQLLRECLRSVFAAATTLRVRVCVVDNASTDASAEMVRAEFPAAHLIVNRVNLGFSAGNNAGLRWFGLGANGARRGNAVGPNYVLLLNPDTVVPPTAIEAMVRFMEARPEIGIAGPRVRRPDGSLDHACRRSFPTPAVSFYRMVGLSRLLPRNRHFNAYNLAYYPEDAVHPVDAVVGAFMLLRREAIDAVGLLDEAFKLKSRTSRRRPAARAGKRASTSMRRCGSSIASTTGARRRAGCTA
jgi:GT2 family glycosyltransferase